MIQKYLHGVNDADSDIASLGVWCIGKTDVASLGVVIKTGVAS